MTRWLDSIYHSIEKITAVFLAVVSVLLLISVIGRQIGKSLVFTEELSLFLYVWIVFLGAALVMRDNGHSAITFIPDSLPKKIRTFHQSILYLSIILFSGVLFYQGIKLVALVYYRTGTTIDISVSYTYAAVPVGALFIIIFCIENLNKLVSRKTGGLIEPIDNK